MVGSVMVTVSFAPAANEEIETISLCPSLSAKQAVDATAAPLPMFSILAEMVLL
jgi:hypothetical protein